MLRKLFYLFLILLGGLILASTVLGWQSYRFWMQGGDGEPVAFEIYAGAGLSQVAEDLYLQDLISSPFWFKVYATLDGSARFVQAGNFALEKGLSYSALMDRLLLAEQEEIQITIPEGSTLAQMKEIISEQVDFTDDEWDDLVGVNGKMLYTWTSQQIGHPEGLDGEGYFLPETYRVFKTAKVEDVLARMQDQLATEILAEEIDLSSFPEDIQSLHDILTVASILEREVRSADEMAEVAGIIYNRLEIGMPLQMDSTVNYVIDGDSASVSYDDLEVDSPYNTYKYPGLPPGPISNPGASAIHAALHPESTSNFYFLTSPEGTVYYAETFDQHIQNRNLYLR